MGLWKNIKKKINEYKLNRRIARTKYIHVMFNDKFNKPYVDFINSNFDSKEHLILVHPTCTFPMPEGENVVVIQKMKHIKFNGRKTEKIIFHSLFDSEFVDYLYAHPDILKEKAYWYIWGGDLYDAPKDEKNDFIRKNFKGYIACVKGDEELAAKTYNANAETFYAQYGTALNEDDFKNNIYQQKHDTLNILINNSSDFSTLEIMDLLKKFNSENIKIYTILSYGQTQFNEKILEKGRYLFGDKFEGLTEYMSKKDYINFLSSCDILILNQDRQQGCGNALMMLALGKKVFIKSNVTTFNCLNYWGMDIFDTLLLKNMTLDEIRTISDEQIERNKKSVFVYYSNDAKTKTWKKVFES